MKYNTIFKKTYFCRHFEMCKNNLKATWKEKDKKPDYFSKNS